VETELCALAPLREILLRNNPATKRDYKKKFHAPATTDDRPQLLAASSVNLILTHSSFPCGKNLWIFVFKIWFEISWRDITLYLTVTCAMRNRKMGRKSLSRRHIVTYLTKS